MEKLHMTAKFIGFPRRDGTPGRNYIGYILEYPGVNTQGETMEEVRENLMDAFTAMLEAKRLFPDENPAEKFLVGVGTEFAEEPIFIGYERDDATKK